LNDLSSTPLRDDLHGDLGAVLILAAALFVTPAVGVPHEDMLQDTFKSGLMALAVFMAAAVFFFGRRRQASTLVIHWAMALAPILCIWALASTAWGHQWLAVVEALRWAVLAVVVALAAQVARGQALRWIAWCVHLGSVVAAGWACVQFLWGVGVFPQGPNPGSTFLNRNFFAEYAVSALPFGLWLLLRCSGRRTAYGLAASNALVVVAIMMTGTRSALVALWMQLFLLWPLVVWRCRAHFACAQWSRPLVLRVAAVFAAVVLALGAVPSANPSILAEQRGTTGIERAAVRTAAIHPSDESLGMRFVMWRATIRAIEHKPLLGIGAGAWEAFIPLYQNEPGQSDQEYYAHNEYLQLIAEYGLAGWLFLLALAALGARLARQVLTAEDSSGARSLALCALLALLTVSALGFPWRLAMTGVLFALGLAIVIAAEPERRSRPSTTADRGDGALNVVRPLMLGRWWAAAGCVASLAGLLGSGYIFQQARLAERSIITAAKLSLEISATGQPKHPSFASARERVVTLARQGLSIHPHYRKITPVVAEQLARWGDLDNALAIWHTLLASRPYALDLLTDAARAHAHRGQAEIAWQMLELARRLQPLDGRHIALSAEMLMGDRREDQARELVRSALSAGVRAAVLLDVAFAIFSDKDPVLAVQALRWRIEGERSAAALVDLHLRLGRHLAARAAVGETVSQSSALSDQAVAAFRAAVVAAPASAREAVLMLVPESYRGLAARTT